MLEKTLEEEKVVQQIGAEFGKKVAMIIAFRDFRDAEYFVPKEILEKAGVKVIFTQNGDATHNARKIRQLAGNAVANGMSWNAALAAITSTPAEAFAVGNRIGKIEPGMSADIVLWSGDPLEVSEYAQAVWIDGKPLKMQSRQTLLRDRYMQPATDVPVQYPATK